MAMSMSIYGPREPPQKQVDFFSISLSSAKHLNILGEP